MTSPYEQRRGWTHDTAFGLFVWFISAVRVAFALARAEPSSFEVNVAFALAIGSTWLFARGAWRLLRAERPVIADFPDASHPYRASIRKP